jgi:DnaK suppressor protein
MTMNTHSAASSGRRIPAADPRAELHAYLTEIEAARQRQLEALPATDLDAVAAAHRACVERILQEVRNAIGRLDAGVYGKCAECGREIPQDRLELRPWAITCAACGSRNRSTVG